MKKTLLIVIVILAVFMIGLPVLNLAVGLPSNRLLDLKPDDPGTAQAVSVIGNKCVQCHSADPALPFYGKWPVAGSIIRHDIREGTKHVDYISEFLPPDGRPVSEVALAKTEYVVQNDTMPPAPYLMMHWNHGLSADENEAILDWIGRTRAEQYAAQDLTEELRTQAIRPLPTEMTFDPGKVALGDKLFHDVRLSKDDTISCASCHALDKGGTDQRRFSIGVGEAEGGVNSPTVFNSGYFFAQFWDGRATTLEDQADGPVNNPIEMASNWEEVIGKLNRDRQLTREFRAVYRDGYSKDNIIDAIAAFERTLITPNSPFDRYLTGDEAAMTDDQKSGYELFAEYKCATCHVGPAMGGQSYEVMGLHADYFGDRGGELDSDKGRRAATGVETDLHRFKVPTLRNIALTYPYLHDGSIEDLSEVVQVMAKYQVGREMPEDDVRLVTVFLEGLTGEYQGQPLQ